MRASRGPADRSNNGLRGLDGTIPSLWRLLATESPCHFPRGSRSGAYRFDPGNAHSWNHAGSGMATRLRAVATGLGSSPVESTKSIVAPVRWPATGPHLSPDYAELLHPREPNHTEALWRFAEAARLGWQEHACRLHEHGRELYEYPGAGACSARLAVRPLLSVAEFVTEATAIGSP